MHRVFVVLAAAAALCAGPAHAQRPATLSCVTGAVGDTLRIEVRGNSVAVRSGDRQIPATIRISDAHYAISFRDGATLAINRDTGEALLITADERPVFYRCRRGGPRL